METVKNFERINRIWQHPDYQSSLQMIADCEADRIFCRHTMAHFLDVARLAQILNLEEAFGIRKELIYGAALLHDIGRHRQYLEGIPHEEASVPIAEEILKDCGFEPAEIGEILEAIVSHRNEKMREERTLAGLIYRADKMSRMCFACGAQDSCHKAEEKKRLKL